MVLLKLKRLFIFCIFLLNVSITYSSDVSVLELHLKKCPEYDSNNLEQSGILEWISAVDRLNKCNMKVIKFLSSQRALSTIDSNLVLLKLEYKYCEGSTLLVDEFTERKTKLLALLDKCKLDKGEETLLKKIFSHFVTNESASVYNRVGESQPFIKLKKNQPLLLISIYSTKEEEWGRFIFYINEDIKIGFVNIKDTTKVSRYN